jgi:hypothetical protein
MKLIALIYLVAFSGHAFAQESRRVIFEKTIHLAKPPQLDTSITCSLVSEGIGYIEFNSNAILAEVKKHTKLQDTLDATKQGNHISPFRVDGFGGRCAETVQYISDYLDENDTIRLQISLVESSGERFGVYRRILSELVLISLGEVEVVSRSDIRLEGTD